MFTGIVQAVGRIATAQAMSDGLALTLDVAARSDLSDLSAWATALRSSGLLPDDRRHRRRARSSRFDVVGARRQRAPARLDRPGPSQSGEGAATFRSPARRSSDGRARRWRRHRRRASSARQAMARTSSSRSRRRRRLRALSPAKGSIAVDGVSLTDQCGGVGRRFSVNLIPHTLAVTTLGSLVSGTRRVNLEVRHDRALRRAVA